MKNIITLAIFCSAFIAVVSAQSPDFTWANNYGGIGGVGGAAGITADKDGNIYMIADYATESIDFGSIHLVNCPGTTGQNVCLVKFDDNGNALWARNACGDFNYLLPVSVTTDQEGNVYMTGYYEGDSVTFGSVTIRNPFSTGLYDNLFIVKYNSGGNALWARTAGGSGLLGSCRGTAIAADPEGNAYAAGYYSSHYLVLGNDTIFNTDPDPYGLTDDFFIAKLDPSGNITWVKNFGGTGSDQGNSISVNGSNLYLTGYYGSQTISFQGIVLHNFSADYPYANLFITRFDTAGNIVWAKGVQTEGNSYGVGITSNTAGKVYITGNFGSTQMIIGSDTLINHVGGSDFNLFTAVYDASGNPLWAKAPEEGYKAVVKGISTDSYGNFYIAGMYSSDKIRFDSITMMNDYGGYYDILVVKYSEEGNVLWAKSVGGDDEDFGEGITVYGENTYITGMFWSYNITFGGILLTGHGTPDYSDDIYVAGLSGSCTGPTITSQPQDQYQVTGGTVTFHVQATGSPEIRYQWYRNGYELTGAEESSYTTWPLTSSNNGDTYYCAVSNCSYSNTVNSRVATVEVCTGGDVYIYPWDGAFRVDDTLTFTANTYGTPPFNLQWYRNGTEIPGASDSAYTTPPLVLSDTGTIYTCRIINCRDLDTTMSNHAVLRLIHVGIDDRDGTGIRLSVYPNPARNKVFIDCSEKMDEIEVFDPLGKRVLQNENAGKNFSFMLDKPGIYIVSVKTREGIINRKLVMTN
jgi:hypothetical protein